MYKNHSRQVYHGYHLLSLRQNASLQPTQTSDAAGHGGKPDKKSLRMLEQYGLIHWEVYREVPPQVEYSLTEIGRKLIPVLEALEKWAREYEQQQNKL